MPYSRRLLIALLCAQVPMLAGVVLPLIGTVALATILGNPLSLSMLGVSALLGAQPYAYALITVLLYGAPLYAFLAQRGSANWLTAAVLGLAPGVGALLIGVYPSGRLADANVTIGPLVMMCGLYVALGTHAVAREVELAADRTVRQILRGSALPLARVFLIAAIFGEAYVVMRSANRPLGTDFAGLGLLFGPVMYVIPFLLAALGCVLYSYFATPKPRGMALALESVVHLAIGVVLLVPTAYMLLQVLRIASRG